MLDLDSFLEHHRDGILRIQKSVPLEHIGALVAQANQTIVFEDLRGYPEFRLVDLLFVNRSAQARVLGCTPSEVVPRLAEVLRMGPRPLRQVDEAPCQERVFTNDDLDLAMLPVVRHTGLDPYPYTTSFAIHRDPETGQYNQMFPRCGVLGRREMVASFVTPTANRILAKHRAAGTRMPQAVVIGAHPAWELCGCYSHPHERWWELELFEAITGRPGEVVKGRTVDLPVPADALIHQAVLKACDALDGITDGILNDPRRCHFDPKVLECKGSGAPTCLTAAQVEAARRIYAGPINPHTGEQIFPGLEPGSELGWWKGPPRDGPVSFFRYVLFKNPNWSWRDLNFDRDVTLADRQAGSILNAINPNLKAFKAHGGKLIMYHGWSDPVIAPLNSVNYDVSVLSAMGGPKETENFIRLFMVPGMLHCGRGLGPDVFDKVGALEQWVENGKAPNKIIASHLTHGVVDMTRPLCPYPEIAQWNGRGSTNDATNFACVAEKSLKASAHSQGP